MIRWAAPGLMCALVQKHTGFVCVIIQSSKLYGTEIYNGLNNLLLRYIADFDQ